MKKLEQLAYQRTIGSVLVALVFILGLATVYPSLHQALHVDQECANHCGEHSEQNSEESEHCCAVTLLQAGIIFWIETPLRDSDVGMVESINHSEGILALHIFYRLPSGRAPPIAGIV